MVLSEKAKDIQNKRPTTWRQNPDAKLKVPSDALRMRWAARVIEYRACGLSWEECSRLIHSKEMTPYFAQPRDVLEIARWRLMNVHQDKMTMPPEGWMSDQKIDEAHDKEIRITCRAAWFRAQKASGRVWDEGESWHEEFAKLYPEDTTDYRKTLREFCHALAPTATTG